MHLLDLAHWSLVAALKEQGTLSAAAAVLGVTQSAATQRLQEAERRLGVALTQKEGRVLVLTPAGRIVAEAAHAAQPVLQQAESDAIWQGKRTANQLKLAVSHFDPPALILRLIGLCRDALTDVSVEIARVPGDRTLAAFADRTVDLALVPGRQGRPAPASRPVLKDRLVAVFPRNDPVGRTAPVRPEMFAGKSFLTYDLRPEPGWEYDRFFQRGQSFPGKAVKIESTELICRLVAGGAGASILPGLCVSLSDHLDSLAVAELEGDPVRFDWHLLHAAEIPDALINRVASAAARWPTAV